MVAGTISTMPGAVASAWTNRTLTATNTWRKSAALLATKEDDDEDIPEDYL